MVFISPDLIGRLFIGGGSLWGGVPLSHASEVDGTNPGFGAIAFLGDVQGPFPWETNQAWCFFFFLGGFWVFLHVRKFNTFNTRRWMVKHR